MKKTVLLAMMATVLLMVLPSCGPDEDPLSHFTDGVKVTTADPTYITNKTACCGAEVTADDNGLLIALGVCYSMTSNPTIDDLTVSTHRCSQPFIGLLTNLEPNTEYHVRGYAQYGTEYCYGEEKTFTTFADSIPTASPVTTLPAFDITCNGFTCNVDIIPFGANNWYPGVCISRNPDFTLENCDAYFYGGYLDDNPYHAYCYCHDLAPNTKYYYRAFVSYQVIDNMPHNEYFYGEILSVTTPDIPFIIEVSTEGSCYQPWNYVLIASGYMSCNKPGMVDQVGFCYSTTNPYPEFESDTHIVAGTPTGTWDHFEGQISASNGGITLNTTYYIRAYAHCPNDSICYGNVESVDTW